MCNYKYNLITFLKRESLALRRLRYVAFVTSVALHRLRYVDCERHIARLRRLRYGRLVYISRCGKEVTLARNI